MTVIRNSLWAALALAAMTVGCTPEEPPAAAPGAPTLSPSTPPPGKASEPKPTPDPAKKPMPDDVKPDSAAPAPKETGKEDAPKLDPPKTAAAELSAAELASLKKLPPADQEIALKQVVCPVSGDHLGAEEMEPVKVTAEGKTFFLCCASCKKEVDKDAKAVIAKLGK